MAKPPGRAPRISTLMDFNGAEHRESFAQIEGVDHVGLRPGEAVAAFLQFGQDVFEL
ncbi:MAG: hypothetical protein ABI165_11365 [Bryobacteraceae bacterium]